MSSFWDVGGEDLQQSQGSYEQEGGDIKPIPDGTQVLALIDEAKWDAFQEGDDYISLRWSIMAPNEFKNRKVFQKLWVKGNNPNQADEEKRKAQGVKAKKMLAAIDHNAGGKLMATGEAPTDDSMARSITNKPMVLKLKVWEMEIQGEKKTGNWIAAVSPRNAGAKKAEEEGAKEPAPQAQQTAPGAGEPPAGEGDDEIPF